MQNKTVVKEAMTSIQTPEDQYTKVGQINARFWFLGDEGTTVILLHGIGASVESWITNINSLAQNHRVYAIDLVGFGYSDKPSVPTTFSYGAQFVKDFMETQHIGRATLVGNSLGGGVTLQFAIQFADRVEKLVLVASGGLGKEVNLLLRMASLPLIGELLTRPSRKGTSRLLRQCIYDPALVADDLVELFYRLAALPGAQESFLSTLRAAFNFWGMRADLIRSTVDNLATIAAPTLIVWGQQDRILPVAHAYVAEKRIPNARLHIFDACGHLPQLERPNEFNAVVLEFLSS